MPEAKFPTHAVLLRNDNRNTQGYVINVLAKYCEVDQKEAQRLIEHIEKDGEAIVFKSMSPEKVEEVVASLKAAQLSAFFIKGGSAK